MDCDANEQLCEEDRWDIEGFPTIKVIRGTTIHDYEGARVAEDIAAFMREVSTFDTLTDDDTEVRTLGCTVPGGARVRGVCFFLESFANRGRRSSRGEILSSRSHAGDGDMLKRGLRS